MNHQIYQWQSNVKRWVSRLTRTGQVFTSLIITEVRHNQQSINPSFTFDSKDSILLIWFETNQIQISQRSQASVSKRLIKVLVDMIDKGIRFDDSIKKNEFLHLSSQAGWRFVASFKIQAPREERWTKRPLVWKRRNHSSLHMSIMTDNAPNTCGLTISCTDR